MKKQGLPSIKGQFWLTVAFGPLGLFYSTPILAWLMIGVCGIMCLGSPFFGLAIGWTMSIIMGHIYVDGLHHRKFLRDLAEKDLFSAIMYEVT